MIKNSITGWIWPLVICIFLAQPVAGRIIYVDVDAQGANNGTRWKDSYRYLRDALAATKTGWLCGWGRDWEGQASPPEGKDFVAIAAGFLHSLALKSDGSIVGWGRNSQGEATPPDGNDFVAIAAGNGHSVALKSDGSVVCWGDNLFGQAAPPKGNDFVAIATGDHHNLAIRANGSIVGWGRNNEGAATPPGGNEFMAIAAGAEHSLALRSDGSILGWGRNQYGQATPPEGNDFVVIAARSYYSLALKSDGSIVGWGGNTSGRASPPAGTDFVAVAAGVFHGLALKSDGSIVGWGNNYDGEVTPPDGNDYMVIAAGWGFSLGIQSHLPPTLAVMPPTGMSSSGNWGGPFNPSSETYTLTNTGSELLTWSASKDRIISWVSLSQSSGTLASGATTTVTVSINSNANSLITGDYSETFSFTNQTNYRGNTTRSVSLQVGLPGDPFLLVEPSAGFNSWGDRGGPFSLSCKAYMVRNTAGGLLTWSASRTQSWVSLSRTSGTLAAGASTIVTVSINSSANNLPSGNFSDTVSFTNQTNHQGDTTRPVSVHVPQWFIYVDDDAVGTNDGTSWADAFKYLQDALATASSGCGIRVAQGIYRPDRDAAHSNGTGDREATFGLVDGIAIRGGYAGYGAVSPDTRDIRVYETILSGDLNGDDVEVADPCALWDEPLRVDNSYHVVTARGLYRGTLLDGFTITGGNADGEYDSHGEGGGLYVRWSNGITVTRCTVRRNSAGNIRPNPPTGWGAWGFGGGIYCYGSSISLSDCMIADNLSCAGGGGIGARESSLSLSNCIVEHNSALSGGGLKNEWGGPIILTNCTFARNSGYFHGASSSGSAVNTWGGSPFVLTNCTFVSNLGSGDNYWGGEEIQSYGGNMSMVNCVLWGNAAASGRHIRLANGASLALSYCDVQGGKAQVDLGEDCTLDWGPGNIDVDPNLTPDGHLRVGSSSPCIAAGTPTNAPQTDQDGEPRGPPFGVDIGSDQFVDTDRDHLPDYWEQKYFGGLTAADPRDDADGDGLANLDEYELYSSNPMAQPIYVSLSAGPLWTIQEGILAANDGDTVLVAAGTYTGLGNVDLDFGGKSIVLKALDGPELTVIDCEGSGRGFYFHSGEGPAAAVVGFTITNGQADYGGAIYCERSHPQFRDCIITGNDDPGQGAGGIYCYLSTPTFADCIISNNQGDGIHLEYGGARIAGTVQLISDEWVGNDMMLYGDGTLQVDRYSVLLLDDSRIRCNLSGPGTIQIDLDSELIIEGVADVNLGDGDTKGTIQCDGLLRARGSARISNANINVTRASFEGDVIISNSVITAEAGAPYGQFFIEDTVEISGNDIHADGDRYMDFEPSVFRGVIENNRIYVKITEGQNNTRGGLLELRGKDFQDPPCESNEFLCHIDNVPSFDTTTWTIERLELVEGTKVNLTNRFDFGNGHFSEVMYVKDLVLGPGSVLNTGFNRLYYDKIYPAETALIKNVPLLGFSLNTIAFDDYDEFATRIVHNNFEHPENPDYNRIHIRHVTGFEPDPKGMMQMCNLKERDPDSPRHGDIVHARAKGLFAKASEDRILVMFEYLFEDSDPSTKLVLYLSDVPELLAHGDPSRAKHYVKVASLPAPPPGRPGSAGSGRFGTFHQYVSPGHLDFIRGTRIELELEGPEGACVLINNWDPQVHCDGICMDLNWSNVPDEEDFMIVIGEYGKTAGLLEDATNSRACLDGAFSTDGYVDVYDVASYDWALRDLDRVCRLNLCGVPLSKGIGMMSTASGRFETSPGPPPVMDTPYSLSDLLIVGKRSTSNDPAELKLKDRLYAFDSNGQYVGYSAPASDRCNIRLVRGPTGELYYINSETGVLRLGLSGEDEVIIHPGETTYTNEPRYNRFAVVYVGVQGQGSDSFGRPIFDAAFDEDYVYVVPVVVDPDGNKPYTAAAKLQLLDSGDPPYQVIQLYDDPPLVADNQYRNNLREIEIDSAGNLYVVNVHSLNESDILWKYGSDGTVLRRLDLGNPNSDSYLPDPIGMYVSDTTDMVYLASAQYNEDPDSTIVYGFSKEELVLKRSITINGMRHVTGITEDPATRSLWVVGFGMEEIPDFPDPTQPPFYHPYLAKVTYGGDVVSEQAVSISGSHDLALPMSIVWTAESFFLASSPRLDSRVLGVLGPVCHTTAGVGIHNH